MPQNPFKSQKMIKNNGVSLLPNRLLCICGSILETASPTPKNFLNQGGVLFLKSKWKIKRWTLWRKERGGIHVKDNVDTTPKRNFRRYRRETILSTLGNPMNIAWKYASFPGLHDSLPSFFPCKCQWIPTVIYHRRSNCEWGWVTW